MRVREWIVSLVAVAALSPLAASAESRTVELSCVNKVGENTYRAADGSVVWTDSCGHESRCADATVTFGAGFNNRVIRWYGGGTCHVNNLALSGAAKRGQRSSSSSPSRSRRARGTR